MSAAAISTGTVGTRLSVATTRTLLLVLAAFGFQAVILLHAFNDGMLSGLIPWDDCQTLVRAILNLHRLDAGEPGWIVIHSPISDLQAGLGLALGGGDLAAPFLLNGVALALVLYAVSGRAGPASPLVAAALALLVLAQPMTVSAVTFLKADWKGGLLMAAAVYALHKAAVEDRPALRRFGAGLLGLALLAKITAFYLPVSAVATLIAFELLAVAADPRPAGLAAALRARVAVHRPEFAACLMLALGPWLVAFTLAVVGERQLIAYIAYALGDTWRDGLSLPQRLLFYSPFGEGARVWGWLAPALAFFAAPALWLSLRRGDRRFLAGLLTLAAVAGLFLAPLVVARTSNLEFGATFFGVVLGATLVALETFAREVERRGPAIALGAGLAMVIGLPLDAPLFGSAALAPAPTDLRRYERAYQSIAADIDAMNLEQPTIRLLFEQALAPFPNLTLIHHARTGALIDVDRIDEIEDLKATEADALLSFRPAGVSLAYGLDARFAATAAAAQADAAVATLPGFHLVRTYAVTGGEIRLFRRRPTLRGAL